MTGQQIKERQQAQGAAEQIIRVGKELAVSGLIVRTWGNISSRLDAEHFLITASGRDYLSLTAEEIVAVSLENLRYSGRIKPSSEKRVHREVYRQRPEAGFVIHTHQNYASAVSAIGARQITFDREYAGVGRTIICAGYALPGTRHLSANTGQALTYTRGRAMLLSHHGALCWGRTSREAMETACQLERACGVYLHQLEPEIVPAGGHEQQVGQKVILNRSPMICAFMEHQHCMRPYLDDFAQMAGTELQVLPRNRRLAEQAVSRGRSALVKGMGAFCLGADEEEAKALSRIIEKNAMAGLAAMAGGGRPIAPWECRLMRQNYLHRYSRLKDR